MLMLTERRRAFRTIEGWARSALLEAGAIRECEEHGWMRDSADPHAVERALLVARRDPPPEVSPEEAVAAVRDVLDTIGDIMPARGRLDDARISGPPMCPHLRRFDGL